VPIFGSGEYRVQPIFVEDLARIAVDLAGTPGSQLIDAAGPETYTYEEFLRIITRELSRNITFAHTPPALGIALGQLIGLFMNDVLLTKDELRGLMRNKLTSNQAPLGKTLFSAWLAENKENLGNEYTSELKRHFFWKDLS
jgi:NADH dehydrogenase